MRATTPVHICTPAASSAADRSASRDFFIRLFEGQTGTPACPFSSIILYIYIFMQLYIVFSCYFAYYSPFFPSEI